MLRAARAECGTVVASLFVNPAQFEDEADLEAYPRAEARDARVAEAEGVDLLFVPPVEEIYPPGFQTWVEVSQLARGLEGEARPGHFRGVATVCLKLFEIVRPDRAYFGQKDAQQAAVVRRLVRDLALGIEIRVLATVRDPDGLAISSRNARLSRAERERALLIPRALQAGLAAHELGEDAVAAARTALDGLRPDYVATLDLDGALVLAAAARVGRTRLIDNVLLEGELP
jgi:pantoate--beta-alanine ligase